MVSLAWLGVMIVSTSSVLILGASRPAFSQTTASSPLNKIDPRRRTPIVELIHQNRDAVVNISTTQIVQVRSPFGFGGIFDELFDLPSRNRRYKRESVGSGFVLHEKGYVITNAHVVAKTAERKVTFEDGREYEADIVAIDSKHDLAVLRIDPDAHSKPIRPVRLGRSADLLVGETVVAVGNPLGFANSVTAGIVSATDRELPVSRRVTFTGLIQTDAPINPGNSGGPLFNLVGEVIGVNTAIRADAQNIGFAIAVDRLRELLPELLDVERRYGLNVGLIVRDRLTTAGRRVVIDGVRRDSPAHRAGLAKAPAELVSMDGKPIESAFDYYVRLMDRAPGETVRLGVRFENGRQAGRERVVTLTVEKREPPDGGKLLKRKLGVEAKPLTAARNREIGLPERLQGLIVTSVESRSPAARVGLRPGDIITHLGRHEVTELRSAGDLLEEAARGSKLPVTLLRIDGRVATRYTVAIPVR